MAARLLVVDRDPRYCEWLRQHLGIVCPEANVGIATLEEFVLASGTLTRDDCDLVILCTSFGASPEDPHSEGLEWLRQLRYRATFPSVLAIAEDGNELTAVRAIQLGALDYLPKRLLTPDRLRTSVHLALRQMELDAAREAHDGALASTATGALRQPIPGYVIRGKIGESEKACVYLATSAALQRDVALKVSKTERDEGNRREFLARERTALAGLRHAAVVEIYDYGVQDGHEYLAMEYFPRGDLKSRIQQGLDEDDSLRHVEQIATALSVVHQAGLLHRDLKPPNVMLRENGEIVLIDFGLARNLEDSLRSTRTGVLRGSPYYMSPEQALGEDLDARTDLYSLGVIFHEMLTGRKLYTGTSAIEVLQQHVNAPLPRLPAALARYQTLLDRLLAKSRDERFASAEQVIAAVAAARALRAAQSAA